MPASVSPCWVVHWIATPAGHHGGNSRSTESAAAPLESLVGDRIAHDRGDPAGALDVGSYPGLYVLDAASSGGSHLPKVNPKHSSGGAGTCATALEAPHASSTIARTLVTMVQHTCGM